MLEEENNRRRTVQQGKEGTVYHYLWVYEFFWVLLTNEDDEGTVVEASLSFFFFLKYFFPIKKSQHELKNKKIHVAPHLSDLGATSAKTKSKLVLDAKTTKYRIHRWLFCILIS